MDTKFIGVDGYGKFDSLSTNDKTKKSSARKSDKKLSAYKKTLRFVKRLVKEIKKDLRVIGKKWKDITWKTLTFKKFFKGMRNFHIKGSYFEFMRSPKGIATALAPVCAAVILVLTVCFWTCSEKPLTVSLDGEYIGTIESESVLTEASANFHSALTGTKDSKCATPVLQIGYPTLGGTNDATAQQVYEKFIENSDAVVSNVSGLYVDGEFYGATEDSEALSLALMAVLDEAKAKYDETTVASFNNDVQVVTDVYLADQLKSVEDIMNEAKHSFSIRIETDLIVDSEIPFETIYEYDDSKLNNYSQVKVAGENGTQQTLYRLVYVDGAHTDTVTQSVTVSKEPVNQVEVVGTQESYIGTGDFIWPVPSTGLCTTLFENRWGSFHSGIDIAGSGIYGADIVASDAGTVVAAGDNGSGYGNQVIIDHGNGYSTMYAHCAFLYVSVGDKVSKGTVLAGVGSTGFSTGNHLHFEIWENGTPIDPLLFMTPTEVDRSL